MASQLPVKEFITEVRPLSPQPWPGTRGNVGLQNRCRGFDSRPGLHELCGCGVAVTHDLAKVKSPVRSRSSTRCWGLDTASRCGPQHTRPDGPGLCGFEAGEGAHPSLLHNGSAPALQAGGEGSIPFSDSISGWCNGSTKGFGPLDPSSILGPEARPVEQ